jgi:hypothetical protein
MDGLRYAWVPEWPGTGVRCPSVKEAVVAMKAELSAFLFFLRHYGEEVPHSKALVLEIVECSTEGAFPYPYAMEPLTSSEQGKLLRWLNHSRLLLLSLLDDLPKEAWTWMKKGIPGRPLGKRGGGWTIEAYLKHIAIAEKWYLSNFWTGLPRLRQAEDARERLDLVRQQLKDCFAKVTAEERKRLVKKYDDWWCLRTVLRRALGHERWHARAIASLLLRNHRPLKAWQSSALF